MPTPSAETMPEGTDSIVAGASATGSDARPVADASPAAPLDGTSADTGSGLRARAASTAASLRDQAGERTADLRGQAGDKAREFAEQGKERATTALQNVSKLIGDAATQVDEKVGAEYGDYARRAADAVDGLAATLRDKDVDTLVADARDLVKRSPALAIGAAAVVGFTLVRLVKAGAAPETAGDPEGRPGRTSTAPKTGKKKA